MRLIAQAKLHNCQLSFLDEVLKVLFEGRKELTNETVILHNHVILDHGMVAQFWGAFQLPRKMEIAKILG